MSKFINQQTWRGQSLIQQPPPSAFHRLENIMKKFRYRLIVCIWLPAESITPDNFTYTSLKVHLHNHRDLHPQLVHFISEPGEITVLHSFGRYSHLNSPGKMPVIATNENRR